MSIDNDVEARFAYEDLVKMHGLCDRIIADTTGHPKTREDELESIRGMMRKIERQLLAYLTRKYVSEPASKQPDKAEVAA